MQIRVMYCSEKFNTWICIAPDFIIEINQLLRYQLQTLDVVHQTVHSDKRHIILSSIYPWFSSCGTHPTIVARGEFSGFLIVFSPQFDVVTVGALKQV